jgi:hypothetical protein
VGALVKGTANTLAAPASIRRIVPPHRRAQLLYLQRPFLTA